MIYASNFQSKHYLVLPSSDFRSPDDLNFMVNLSGVAVLDDFKGSSNGSWKQDVIFLSDYGMGMESVLARANSLLPPLPPNRADGSFASRAFVPLQWTIHASFNSIFNAGTSVNAGYEIDDWKIARADIVIGPNSTVKVFQGFQVDLSVRDKDGEIKKIGYDVSMHGYFAVVWNSRID